MDISGHMKKKNFIEVYSIMFVNLTKDEMPEKSLGYFAHESYLKPYKLTKALEMKDKTCKLIGKYTYTYKDHLTITDACKEWRNNPSFWLLNEMIEKRTGLKNLHEV